MPEIPTFVEAVNANGEKQTIPYHWLDHPVLGVGFHLAPKQRQLLERTETPSDNWTDAQLREHAEAVGISLAGAHTKADVLSAINNTPDTGDKE